MSIRLAALELARRLSVGASGPAAAPVGSPGPLRPRPPQLDLVPPAVWVVVACDRGGRLRWSPGGASLAVRLGWRPGPLTVISGDLWTSLEAGEGPCRWLRPGAAPLADGRLWLGLGLRIAVASSGRVLAAAAAPGRLAVADPARVLASAGLPLPEPGSLGEGALS